MDRAELIVGLGVIPADATVWLLAAAIFGIAAGGILTAWALRSRCLRLQGATELEHRRAAVLDEAYRAFASSLDLETTLERVIRASTEVLGDSCCIQLIDRDTDHLRPACAFDQRAGDGRELHAYILSHPIRLGEGLSGHVAETGKPLLVSDFASSPYALPEFPEGATVPRALAVPLLVDGRVTGVLTSAYSTTERLPEAEDLRLAVLLADRAAIAIEHAQLYRQLETRVEERTRELRQTHRQLLEAEHRRALCELAAVVAHEIRNPLNVIKTAAYYMRERIQGQDERVDRHLDRLERSVDTATYIIQDLMDYGAFPDPDPSLFDMADLAREVAGGLSLPPGVQLVLELPAGPACVQGDRHQILRALKHLLVNAIQSLDGPGVVTLAAREAEDRVVVEVRDTGRGVPEANRGRIFDPLFSTKTKGTGLGLTLTRRILETNGGGIRFESAEGAGSAFEVWLPAAPVVSPLPAAPADATPEA